MFLTKQFPSAAPSPYFISLLEGTLNLCSYSRKQRSNYARKKRWLSPIRGGGLHRCDDKVAQLSFETRSKRAQSLDLIKLAPLAPNISVYLRSQNRLDWPGVDAPFDRRAEAVAVAKLAKGKFTEEPVKSQFGYHVILL